MKRWVSKCGLMELRLGDYREVLADVRPQIKVVITDPPYSEATHVGHNVGAKMTYNAKEVRPIDYGFWTVKDVRSLIRYFKHVGWLVAFSDDGLAPWYRNLANSVGRYTFSPLPWIAPGSRFRVCGDGPVCVTTQINCSRKTCRPWCAMGTLPGYYLVPSPRDRSKQRVGGKPIELMKLLVKDYSRENHFICDPCAGYGTTLLAAATLGRRSIGAEIDPETFEKAVAYLSKGYTPTLGI